jgi:hypothetical protein
MYFVMREKKVHSCQNVEIIGSINLITVSHVGFFGFVDLFEIGFRKEYYYFLEDGLNYSRSKNCCNVFSFSLFSYFSKWLLYLIHPTLLVLKKVLSSRNEI